MTTLVKTMYQAILSNGPKQSMCEALLDKTFAEFGLAGHNYGRVSPDIMKLIAIWGEARGLTGEPE